jgi:hypothetical protein
VQGHEEKKLWQRTARKLPGKEDLHLLLCFYDTYIYYNTLASKRQDRSIMESSGEYYLTITFENNCDVIANALEKKITFARENHYLFVANCVW